MASLPSTLPSLGNKMYPFYQFRYSDPCTAQLLQPSEIPRATLDALKTFFESGHYASPKDLDVNLCFLCTDIKQLKLASEYLLFNLSCYRFWPAKGVFTEDGTTNFLMALTVAANGGEDADWHKKMEVKRWAIAKRYGWGCKDHPWEVFGEIERRQRDERYWEEKRLKEGIEEVVEEPDSPENSKWGL